MQPPEQIPINITFRITDISVHKFNVFTVEAPVGVSSTEYQFNLKTQIKIEAENKLISIINHIDVFFAKDLTNRVIEFESEIKYIIDNFDDIVIRAENAIQMPEVVIKMFLGVSISTVRGILFSRSFDTQYSKVYLPVIDVSKLSPQIIDPAELKI